MTQARHGGPESSLVAIESADGEIVGCGFLVSDRLVLTCAHVVNAAVGAQPDERVRPAQQVIAEFPLVAAGQTMRATVQTWVPIEADATGDIALLHLADPPPAAAEPVRLATTPDTWDHPFRTYGFPRGYPGGLWASGRILGRQRHGWVQLEDVKAAGAAVERGFSGAAVYDEQLHAVVGMVVAQDLHESNKIAFMLPADTLAALMPAGPATAVQQVPVLGPLRNVPTLPPRFAPRPGDVDQVRRAVLDGIEQPVDGGRMVSVVGMGGAGKSVLAAAVSRSDEIRRAFRDGVVWVELGPSPSIVERQAQIAVALGYRDAGFADPQQGKTLLGRLLAEGRWLVVLDNVWRPEHLAAFDVLGPHCRLLLTTRDVGLARAATATRCEVGLLDDAQALDLLARWAGQPVETLPAEAVLVARECGNLPLALSMAGAMIEGRPERWSGVLRRLQRADLDKIRQSSPNYPYPDLLRAIDVSVAALEPDERERYLELVTFEGRGAPRVAIELIWEPAGLDDLDTDELLHLFVDRSLARLDPDGRLYLHDLQMDYVRHYAADVARLHRQLVEAYRRKASEGWPSGPADGYYFENLAHHLVRAGLQDEAQTLLLDLTWLSAKLSATDVAALLADYDIVAGSETIELVRGALRLAGHILAREPGQLPAQLAGRLADEPAPQIRRLVAQVRNSRADTWWCPAGASLIAPGGPLQAVLVGHTGWLRALATSPDNRTVVSGANDGTVRVWNLDDGSERYTLHGHDGAVWSLALTPDDRTIVSGATDGTVRVWGLRDGVEKHVLRGHESIVWSVAVTPDGRHAVSGSADGTVRVWDLDTGIQRHVLRGHRAAVSNVAAPDDQTAASRSEDGTVRIWNLSDGSQLHCLDSGERSIQSTGQSTAFAVTQRHAVISSDGGPVFVWDRRDGMLMQTLKREAVRDWSVVATPDGSRAVTGSYSGMITVWDLDHGTPLWTFRGHSGWVDMLVLTPDHGQVISGATDAIVRVWDIRHGQEVAALRGHTGWVLTGAVTPDGRRMVSGASDATVRVWDLAGIASHRAQQAHNGWVGTVAFASRAGGDWAVSGSDDATVRVWDLRTGAQVRVLHGHTAEVTSLVATADGEHVVSGSQDGTVRYWRLDDGAEVAVRAMAGAVTAVALAGDRVVVTGTDQGTVQVWQLDSDTEPWVRRTGETVEVLTVTPDGQQVVAGCARGTLVLYDLATGADLHVYRGSGGPVLSLAVTPDGRSAVSGCLDGLVSGWDLRSGEQLWEKPAHGSRTYAVQILPGPGGRVVTGGADGVARIWAADTGTEVQALGAGGDPVRIIAVAPDGRRVVCGTGDSAVLWDIETGTEVARFVGDGAMTAAVIDDRGRLVCGEATGGVHVLRLITG